MPRHPPHTLKNLTTEFAIFIFLAFNCQRTSALTSSPESFVDFGGGDERIRTADLLLAGQALSHLSYIPKEPHHDLFLAECRRTLESNH